VTYSDMVTLLLTFFVMLLSLADVQDPELFDKGRDSFIESLRCIGLGMLFGRSNVPNLGDEELRRICEKLREQAMIVPSPVAAERADYSVANVHFSPGGDSLDESARQFLTGFCRDLRQDASRKRVILYVLGLASDGGTEKERVFLSARRAKVVADFLRSNLSLSSQSSLQGRQSSFTEQSRWSVYSWGAGSGGDWANQDSPFSKKSQILIAVLRKTG
jgi:hypothetical protein